MLICLLTPTFEDFLDYYYNFGAVKDSIKDVCLYIGILCVTIIYELYLSDTNVRKLLLFAIVIRIIDNGLDLCSSFGFTFGLPKVAFVYIQTLLFQSTYLSLFDLPIYILVAKMIPVNVESSMFAILSGINAFSQLVYGRLIGCAINTIPNVNDQDFSQMWVLMLVQFISAFLPLFFMWLIPTNS